MIVAADFISAFGGVVVVGVVMARVAVWFFAPWREIDND